MAQPQVTIFVKNPGNASGQSSYFDFDLSGNNFLTSLGSTVDGWCLDAQTDIRKDRTYTATIYSSYELDSLGTVFPSVQNQNNLDLVNWIINQNFTANPQYNYGEVQAAIWTLLGDGNVYNPNGADLTASGALVQADIDAIVAQAQANGENFVPDNNEDIAVILNPVNSSGQSQQPVIIEVKAAKLGDFVWEDTDTDGIQDAGENGIAGVTVNLTRDKNGDGDVSDIGEILATTTTDSTGFYQFKGLTPGLDYQVQFIQPNGFNAVSPRQQGGNAAKDSDGLLSDVIKLNAGEYNQTIDSGFYKIVPKASLGDKVFIDGNGNGIQDTGDAGLGGVTVELIDPANGSVIATTTTDTNGTYSFNNLNPGDYQVKFTPPADYRFTTANAGTDDAVDSDAIPATGLTQTVTLAAGENNKTLDAGVVLRKAHIGDFAFIDSNANGIQDAGEAGLGGVKVELLDNNGNVIDTTTTDANGIYSFIDINPGDYQVKFTPPAGYEFTTANAGTDDAVDSDADANGLTQTVTLVAGEKNRTLDAGLTLKKSSLGDKVFVDGNGNGIQDTGDAGLGGVTVELIDPANGSVIATTTTDTNGIYGFNNLNPGDYQVRFTPPTGYEFTTANAGTDDAVDSDAIPATGLTQTVTLAAGDNNKTLDAGLTLKKASLGDFVWNDLDQDGIQDANEPGIAGATVNLVNPTNGALISTTTTNANGQYGFNNLNPGDYRVEFVTPNGFTNSSPANVGGDDSLDSDGSSVTTNLTPGENDLTIDSGFFKVVPKASLGDRVWEDKNANGIQDNGENGIAGVTVKLLNTQGQEIGSTVTDTNGIYGFNNLNPGDYQVQFVSPSNYFFSPQDKGGNDTLDSDANPSNGTTAIVNLSPGENDTSVDAGLYRKASLGDRVWCDVNKNGIQDSGEVGIANVTVKLIDASGNQVATTTTNSQGNYNFNNLTPGTYSVEFVKPNGFAFSPQDKGGNDTLDSDANPSNGKTQQLNLMSGESNNTVDAGLYKVPCVPIKLCFYGNSPLDGKDGNIYTFKQNNLSVKASAFSRDKATGDWSTSYVGAYSSGLGATNRYEDGNNGTHRVDNVGGRNDYMLFEFSDSVGVDAAYLNSVVQDSDITVWFGNFNDPFNNHLSLNDSILSSMTSEENWGGSSSRWADINSGKVFGNTLVIAASIADTSPEDQFKINALGVWACGDQYC
jgi:protocatechuate 3,4-dioxygenase beta subunit